MPKLNRSTDKNHILIIGFGKLGSSLARLLKNSENTGIYVVNTHPYKEEFETILKPNHYFNKLSSELLDLINLIFICVGDDQISSIVEKLRFFNLQNKVIVHTSGAIDSQILEPLESQGASIGSLHPIQTFNVPFLPPAHWQSIFCTFEGSPQVQMAMQELFKPFGPKIVSVTKEQKQAIHLAATIAANFQVALYSWATEIIENSGLKSIAAQSLLAPLVEKVAINFNQKPLSEILSGPLQRGDFGTLRNHLDYLRNHSDSLSIRLYGLLSQKILQNKDFPIHNRDLLEKFLFDMEN